MPFHPEPKDAPSSVTQVAAAMAALGLYRGATTPAEYAAEAKRLGGDAAYRLRLVNALLGAALVAESLPVSADERLAAYEQQLAHGWGGCQPDQAHPLLALADAAGAGPPATM